MSSANACSSQTWSERGPHWNAPRAGSAAMDRPSCSSASNRPKRSWHRRENREKEARQLEQRLDTIRMDRCILVDGHFDRLRSDREYEEAFRLAGLSPFGEVAKVVADRIKESPARAVLVAALDDWAVSLPTGCDAPPYWRWPGWRTPTRGATAPATR